MTTTISRQFSNGWEVGGHATFTDVPFEKFGEGSFDREFTLPFLLTGLLVRPINPEEAFIRPITRDGGPISQWKSLYKTIKGVQKAQFTREYGRLWK